MRPDSDLRGIFVILLVFGSEVLNINHKHAVSSQILNSISPESSKHTTSTATKSIHVSCFQSTWNITKSALSSLVQKPICEFHHICSCKIHFRPYHFLPNFLNLREGEISLPGIWHNHQALRMRVGYSRAAPGNSSLQPTVEEKKGM